MVEKEFDDMLDDVESANDYFIKNYFSDDSMFVSDTGLIEQEESCDDSETEEKLDEESVDELNSEFESTDTEISNGECEITSEEEITQLDDLDNNPKETYEGIDLLSTDIDKIPNEEKENNMDEWVENIEDTADSKDEIDNQIEEVLVVPTKSADKEIEKTEEKKVKSSKNILRGVVSADFINEQIKKSNMGALELKSEDDSYDDLTLQLDDNSLIDDFEDSISEKQYNVDVDKVLNSDILDLLDETSSANDFFDKLEEVDD